MLSMGKRKKFQMVSCSYFSRKFFAEMVRKMVKYQTEEWGWEFLAKPIDDVLFGEVKGNGERFV